MKVPQSQFVNAKGICPFLGRNPMKDPIGFSRILQDHALYDHTGSYPEVHFSKAPKLFGPISDAIIHNVS